MIDRLLFEKLKNSLSVFPAVAILGPRQVGKTTLAFELTKNFKNNPIYLDLEKPSDRAKLNNPEHYLSMHQDHLVVLDEIQRAPGIFEVLRGIIDERKRNGQTIGHFLILGSASKELLQQSSESLAGRIIYTQLSGFNLFEVGANNCEKLWIRGGFPDSFIAIDDSASYLWRESFITTYLEREVPTLGPRIPAETLRRFWTMLAYNQGELLNSTKLSGNLGVSNTTIARYIDLLVDLFMVRVLKPWSNNVGKRLVKTPKVYIRDSGLTHALLGIRTVETLVANPVVGNSWEGFVIENIASIVGNNANLFFYRTAAGAEIDLLIEYAPDKVIAIEIKRSLTPTLSKSLHEAIATVKPLKTFVVYSGADHYQLSNSIEVISIIKLMEYLKALIP
jgi:hypothetical protein